MDKGDFEQFSNLLDGVYDLLGTGTTKIISASAKSLFFGALANYTLETVRGALLAHCKDPKAGKFPPRPADLINQIDKALNADGRPGAEEAWAKALTAQCEMETVVWSHETAAAFLICQPVLAASGSISARMTFLEAYERLVHQARAEYRPLQWAISLGSNPAQRETALKQAIHAGMLTAASVAGLLPPPSRKARMDAQAQAQLAKIRRMMETRKRRIALVRELRSQRERQTTVNQKRKVQALFEAALAKQALTEQQQQQKQQKTGPAPT